MLQVKDLMSNALEVVSPDTYLHEALKTMNRTGYRHFPVVTGDKLVGIITDRDLRLAINSPVIEEDAALDREKILDEGNTRYDRQCENRKAGRADGKQHPLGRLQWCKQIVDR